MASKYSRTGDAKSLRQEFGQWLKKEREALDRTQLDLARHLDHEYPTTISQFERGITRIPPDDWEKYAQFLGVPTKEFAKRALKYYDNQVYMLIFGDEAPAS